MPPLRDHIEDITELAMHFMRLSAQRCKKDVIHLDDDVLAAFKSFTWPGNIRQLENVIERAVVITEGQTVSLHELASEILVKSSPRDEPDSRTTHGREATAFRTPSTNWRSERERTEREQMVRALAAADGNKAKAARRWASPAARW